MPSEMQVNSGSGNGMLPAQKSYSTMSVANGGNTIGKALNCCKNTKTFMQVIIWCGHYYRMQTEVPKGIICTLVTTASRMWPDWPITVLLFTELFLNSYLWCHVSLPWRHPFWSFWMDAVHGVSWWKRQVGGFIGISSTMFSFENITNGPERYQSGFFSPGVEGQELPILKTIPFDKVPSCWSHLYYDLTHFVPSSTRPVNLRHPNEVTVVPVDANWWCSRGKRS